MAMRSRIPSKKTDKKVFSKTAGATKAMNLRANPMRGGFRL